MRMRAILFFEPVRITVDLLHYKTVPPDIAIFNKFSLQKTAHIVASFIMK